MYGVSTMDVLNAIWLDFGLFCFAKVSRIYGFRNGLLVV